MKAFVLGALLALVATEAVADGGRMTADGGGVTTADSIFCTSYDGIQTIRYGMNEKQLDSLGCTAVKAGISVRILPPTKFTDHFVFVAVETPKKIFRVWTKTTTLKDVKGYGY